MRPSTSSTRSMSCAWASDAKALCNSTADAIEPIASAIARTAVAPMVARDLTEEGHLTRTRPHPVAGAADCLDGRGPKLAAQRRDVHLDHVVVTVAREVPDVFDDLRLRNDFPLTAHQVLDDGELPRRQFDLLPVDETHPGGHIELDVAGAQDGRLRRRAAPQQRTQPGDQHDV